MANAKAIAEGKETFETVIDGKPWKQQSFPYQAKCLQWIRNAYADLNAKDRGTIDPVLHDAGLSALFEK
jgi:hypothetical protein